MRMRSMIPSEACACDSVSALTKSCIDIFSRKRFFDLKRTERKTDRFSKPKREKRKETQS